MYIYATGKGIDKIPGEVIQNNMTVSLVSGGYFRKPFNPIKVPYLTILGDCTEENTSTFTSILDQYVDEGAAKLLHAQSVLNAAKSMSNGGGSDKEFDLIEIKSKSGIHVMIDVGHRDYKIEIQILDCKFDATILEDYFDFVPHDDYIMCSHERLLRRGDLLKYNIFKVSVEELYSFLIKKIRGLCHQDVTKVQVEGFNYAAMAEWIRNFLINDALRSTIQRYTIEQYELTFEIEIIKAVAMYDNVTLLPELEKKMTINQDIIRIPTSFNLDDDSRSDENSIKIGKAMMKVFNKMKLEDLIKSGDASLIPEFDMMKDEEFKEVQDIVNNIMPFNGMFGNAEVYRVRPEEMGDFLNHMFGGDINSDDEDNEDEYDV